MDDALRPVDLDRLPKLPSQHAMHGEGPPMVGLLRAIRGLDHSPVRVQANELATGDIPQQPGAAQSAERALPCSALARTSSSTTATALRATAASATAAGRDRRAHQRASDHDQRRTLDARTNPG